MSDRVDSFVCLQQLTFATSPLARLVTIQPETRRVRPFLTPNLPYTSCQGLVRITTSISCSAAIRPRGAVGRLHKHPSELLRISQLDDLKTNNTWRGLEEAVAQYTLPYGYPLP
jgi:hypothetical protein